MRAVAKATNTKVSFFTIFSRIALTGFCSVTKNSDSASCRDVYKRQGIYRVGSARVRVDVYRTPKPIDTGGRWCVQVGAFNSHRKAEKLKKQLLHKYPNANVIEFPGEDSYWVRIRPAGDNREEAENIARRLRPAVSYTHLDVYKRQRLY